MRRDSISINRAPVRRKGLPAPQKCRGLTTNKRSQAAGGASCSEHSHKGTAEMKFAGTQTTKDRKVVAIEQVLTGFVLVRYWAQYRDLRTHHDH